MKKLKMLLFDHDIFFETKFANDTTEISFITNNYNVSIFFKQNNLIVMLVYNDEIIKTHYSNNIEEILTKIAIYMKIAKECRQPIAVDYI